MIRHIVLFSFGETSESARSKCFETLQNTLVPLAGIIPDVLSLRVDRNANIAPTQWDAALVSEHDSWDALTAYQIHPAHLSALEVVNTIVGTKAVVDYEL